MKQLLIQIGIQLVSSVIVSYIMYRVMNRQEENRLSTTKSGTTSTPKEETEVEV